MPNVVATVVNEDPQNYEDEHVHAVYDEIASHFSSTRYKPWPIIAQFLDSLPTGWVGLDSGTGNGKYLPLPLDRPGSVWTIGMDRSKNLLGLARAAGPQGTIREVVWGDVLGRSWRNGAFDYAISIATIHHLSTHERRKVAVQRLLQCISPTHGRALIYVWAIEQDDLSKRAIPSDSVPTEAVSNVGQDVFVPWVLAQQPPPKEKAKRVKRNTRSDSSEPQPPAGGDVQQTQDPPKVFNRYYHMFAKGELRELVCEAADGLGLHIGGVSDAQGTPNPEGIEIVQDGWERSNYYVELRRWRHC